MTTPQDSPRRKKQKIRRSSQLAKWREKQAAAGATAAHAPKKAATEKKTAPKKAATEKKTAKS